MAGQRRPRAPHYIARPDTAEETVTKKRKSLRASTDDHAYFDNKKNRERIQAEPAKDTHTGDHAFVRLRNERLERLERPLIAGEQWRDIFSGDPTLGRPSTTLSGPWQVSAFALLGFVVVLSAIFLHMVAENSNSENHTPYNNYRRRQRRARRMRKKKTDEWSDDEDDLQNPTSDHAEAIVAGNESPYYPYHYDKGTAPSFVGQEHRHRRTSYTEIDTPPRGGAAAAGRSTYYHLPVNPTYKSPSANIMNISGVHRRGVSPGNSFSSSMSGGRSPAAVLRPTASTGGYSSGAPSPSHSRRGSGAPLSGRLRVPSTPEGKDLFSSPDIHGLPPTLPTPPEGSQLPVSQAQNFAAKELGARPLNASNFPSFASTANGDETESQPHRQRGVSVDDSLSTGSLQANDLLLSTSMNSAHGQDSFGSAHHLYESHHQSLLLTPGNYEAETPQIGNNRRKFMSPENISGAALPDLTSGLQPPAGGATPGLVPFIPALSTSSKARYDRNASDAQVLPLHYAASRPPRSVLLDELRIVQMETGNSTQWGIQRDDSGMQDESNTSYSEENDLGTYFQRDGGATTYDDDIESISESGSDIPIPSGDPRGGIKHKRENLTLDTDAGRSLQANISFDDLDLQEVIGGGGFGQVWRAMWFGTPVAVKVLTGSAQNTHIAKAILEEFKAEINLLKGMRHPNICLYMGACVKPPNRAIVTELAANGSVWDALRLPLSPPYSAVNGTAQDVWPVELYTPGEHGAPPMGGAGSMRVSSPIPPKGTWPWQLVKRVASGAARGMAYLHHGNPPILHRDLKSANLLLDDAYTVKVCDFGLSRLKAQARSMTGNCGTVQWMAPEVLANMDYDEKADIFSYGIILWELLSRECPYEGMTAIQCALAVLNRDKRPDIPKWCPPGYHALIKSCVKKNPMERPDFSQVIEILDAMEA